MQIFARSRKYSDEVFEASENGTITMEEMYIYRICHAFKDFGIVVTDEEALLFQKYYQEYQKKIQLSDEMRSLLQSCVGRCRLGIITNGPAEHQWDKIHALGVLEWIPETAVFVSGELKIAKPDSRIFAYAEQHIGVDKKDMFYVGDSYENDVTGAVRTGWHSIWMNRRHKEKTDIYSPDYEVHTETELLLGLL